MTTIGFSSNSTTVPEFAKHSSDAGKQPETGRLKVISARHADYAPLPAMRPETCQGKVVCRGAFAGAEGVFGGDSP